MALYGPKWVALYDRNSQLGPEGPRGLKSGGYLLAGISFLLITIWLKKKGRPFIYTLVPMVFLMSMTLWAMVLEVVFD